MTEDQFKRIYIECVLQSIECQYWPSRSPKTLEELTSGSIDRIKTYSAAMFHDSNLAADLQLSAITQRAEWKKQTESVLTVMVNSGTLKQDEEGKYALSDKRAAEFDQAEQNFLDALVSTTDGFDALAVDDARLAGMF